VYLIAFDGHSSWPTVRRSPWRALIATLRPPKEKLCATKTAMPGALKEAAGDLVGSKLLFLRAPNASMRCARHPRSHRAGLDGVHSAGQDFEYLDLSNELRNMGVEASAFTCVLSDRPA